MKGWTVPYTRKLVHKVAGKIDDYDIDDVKLIDLIKTLTKFQKIATSKGFSDLTTDVEYRGDYDFDEFTLVIKGTRLETDAELELRILVAEQSKERQQRQLDTELQRATELL